MKRWILAALASLALLTPTLAPASNKPSGTAAAKSAKPAQSQAKKSAPAKRAANKAPAKPKQQTGTKKKSSGAASTGKKAAGGAATQQSSGTQRCTIQRVKNSQGKFINRRVCKPAAQPDLASPIKPDALQTTSAAPAPSSDLRGKPAPERAYAVDGETFFYQGRKYRVEGLKASGNGDMGLQRLQRALDAGNLNLDALDTGTDGVTRARVKIDGRDLARELGTP
ncbi:MAG: hypothetical protein CGU28_02550 [Candidatus Dactylopiibacterium carminicum]|uniref:Uncharacterized protein n=1 Tax=Candidatus Dactylopiibacterium carminicum TaxID=857335 RepID=A0A272EXQ3_9RHOO|nr:hypothetical protein [Candidatus Dactylopiibacterium carminicum]KAF7600542.1 hypothetical protein BGI27_02280 [Candidatus Dactylopiibacterium carminicum]PAS94889.1 MAG: hypothetical protein CGU29_01885 [Candidatus Dactylopiibacterium carminicum]PAS98025.1 MAG: hypothetical protein CGU28_02550 [Candidatus Dactylopiibacterium carminicum]PAT00546.1 MAG: hypothetical protein BSR46_02290 [Candidatus Dactylopiibacterium carminicum]